MKKWEESKYFDLSNKLYNRNLSMVISLAIDEIKKGKVLSLLDLGCSNGYALQEILCINNKRKFFSCGLDIDISAIAEALTKGLKMIRADANSLLPFKEETFDLIISNQLLEHLYYVDNFFKEIHRVLRVRGVAIISTPNLSAWHNLFCLLLGWYPVGVHIIDIQVGNFLRGTETHGHIRLFTYRALKDLCKIYNFELEKIMGVGYYPFQGNVAKLLAKLDIRHCVYFILKIKKI